MRVDARGDIFAVGLAGTPYQELQFPPLAKRHKLACLSRRYKKPPLGGKTKRLFDIVVAGTALTFLAPLLFCVWCLVKLDSPGAGFFKQSRGGFRGRPFEVYKFRTMVEHKGGFEQAVKGDRRVTGVGAILRRCSIDELPQLINVVKGDMSLVGPRPHAIDHDREFTEHDYEYGRRFRARPGVTGLAQVSGSRGPTDTDEKKQLRIRLDQEYIDTWSFFKDIIIMFRTVLVVFDDVNAF